MVTHVYIVMKDICTMAGWLLPGELNGRWCDYMTSHTHSSRWRRRCNGWTCFWDCTPPSTVTSLHKNKHIISTYSHIWQSLMGISHYQDMKPLACSTVSAKCGITLKKHHHVPITTSLRVHRVGDVAIHSGHVHQTHRVSFCSTYYNICFM